MFSNKISLSVVTGIITLIWFMPATIQNSPLSAIISNSNPYFVGFWGFCLLITAILWCYIFSDDRSQKLFFEKFNDEDFQNEFLMSFIRERKVIREITDDKIVVSNIFGKEDLIDYLKFYVYIIIKRSTISLFKTEFPSSDEIFENNTRDETKEELIYSKIYPLRGEWVFGEETLDIEYDGKITFNTLLKLDRGPINSLQKKLLLHNIEKELDSQITKKMVGKILSEAESRGIIKSINTLSFRSFGKLFYITFRNTDDPPEIDPFSRTGISCESLEKMD
jgi:hypothetical protein